MSDANIEEAREKGNKFIKRTESEMYYKSDYSGSSLTFDWVDEIEKACPFIDNVIRRPKLTLIQVENTVAIEKSKRITVASVKDLSKHSNYIDKVDKKTQEVEPNKILDIRSDETYNIYENRFLYTLLDCMDRFIYSKEKALENFEIKDEKVLTYNAKSTSDTDNIKIELKLSSNSIPKQSDQFNEKDIELIKERIKRIKEYLNSWRKSDMVKALDKLHISFINPPIKKTNIFLKNPNFQVAANLWTYLLNYDLKNTNQAEENLETDGDANLKGFLDHSFLIDYLILDSISKSKREQKEKLSNYSIYIITKEINRIISLLENYGVKIKEDDLLKMVSKELKEEKNNRLAGVDDIKKKFKSAMDDYLERIENNL